MLLALICATTSLTVSPTGAETLEFGTRRHPKFGQIRLQGVREVRGADATTDLALLPWGRTGDANNLLHLSFDEELPVLLRDSAGHYRLDRVSYAPSNDARVGKRAAMFIHRENQIVVRSPQELWPGRGPLNDFTIEFWIKPVHFLRRNVLFRKQALAPILEAQSSAGMEIYLEDGHVHVALMSLFRDMRGRKRSLHLVSKTSVHRGQWQHVVFGFQASLGRAALYMGGLEEEVALARDPAGTWRASFTQLDRSPIVIAESYMGLMDEFRIARGAPRGEEGIRNTVYPSLRYHPVYLNAEQPSGLVVSRVIRLPDERLARRADLRVRGIEPKGAALNFFVRTSDRPFADDTPTGDVPWRLVRSGARLVDFAYWQWKAELRADPLGRASPQLRDVRLEYAPYPRPVPPQEPAVIEGLTGGEHVTLEWLRNPESEVKALGGYIVYYGYRSGEYLGRVQYSVIAGRPQAINYGSINALPLTKAEARLRQRQPRAFLRRFTNRVRLTLTNPLIEENLVIINHVPDGATSPARPRSSGMPLLTRNRSYYFAVAAYYRTRTGMVLESPLSKEVVAVLRPARTER